MSTVHEGSKTPATPPSTPADTMKEEDDPSAKVTALGYSRPLIENARRTIWKAVEKARQMERDNDPALSSNEWLKHLAKEKRDWSTHHEAAKGELLYAQQKTQHVIAQKTKEEEMITQQEDMPTLERPTIPNKNGEKQCLCFNGDKN